MGGVTLVEVDGVPPSKVHKYSNAEFGVVEQLLTKADRVIGELTQLAPIILKTTVGGCFTVTVWAADVKEPQELVAVNVTEYIPGFTKLKTGLADILEPFT